MHRLAIALINLSFWLLSRLPLSVLHALGAFLGEWAAKFPGRYGRRLRTHFLHAYPDADRVVLIEAARSAGRMALEIPYFWARKDPLVGLHHLLDPHESHIQSLLEQGHGMIFLTPHLGCFEALAPLLSARYGLTVMFKPPHKIWLRRWIEKMRSRPGLHLAPAKASGIRMLVKALRHGEAVGILPDQTPPNGQGVWAPFFGKPAYTITLVQKLQRLSGAPIVLLFNERLPHGQGYRVHCRSLDTLPEDATMAATILNQAIENLIAIAPTQYIWGYNRYKVPHGTPTQHD